MAHPAGWPHALAGLAALAVAMGIGRFAFTPVLPLMLDEGALSLAGGAWLASANYLGYLIGALSAMMRPLPPQRAIRLGLLIVVVATAAMAAPLPFPAWAALRLVAGAASAWILIAVSAWSMEWAARARHKFLSSLVFAGVGSGIALAGVLCLTFAALDLGAPVTWLALAAAAVCLTVPVWARVSGPLAAAPGPAPRLRGLPREAWRMIASYGLFGFGYIIPATFLPVMARQALGEGSAFAWSWPIFGLAAALSVPLASLLVRRLGARRLWLCCHLTMAVAVVLPLAVGGLPGILGSALGVGGTFMAITAVAVQRAREVAGAHAGVLVAAMTAAFAAGQILGPLTIGSGGFALPLTGAAAALLLGAALLVRRGASADDTNRIIHPQENT